MFDIVKFESDFVPDLFNFKKIYFFNSVKNKIKQVKDIAEAVSFKKQKILILLEEFKFDKEAIREIAAEQKVCFLIDIGQLIKTSGVKRAILLSKISSFLKLCNKFGAHYAIVSFCENKESMRTSDELVNVGYLLGLNAGQTKFAIERIVRYVEGQ